MNGFKVGLWPEPNENRKLDLPFCNANHSNGHAGAPGFLLFQISD